MRFLFLVILFFYSAIRTNGQDISFFKEDITMRIENNAFYVSGLYFLKGEKGEKSTLLYPFPIDSAYKNIDSVFIINLTNNLKIEPVKVEASYLIFKIEFDKTEEIILQIGYKHELKAKKAEYILKTTLSWKRPFDKANYQLIVAPNITITRFSIQPMDSIISLREKIYYWEKRNYMPSENMIFEFETDGLKSLPK